MKNQLLGNDVPAVSYTGSPGVANSKVVWQTWDEELGRQTVEKAIRFLTVAWLLMVFYLNTSLLNFIATNQRSSCCGQKNSGHY